MASIEKRPNSDGSTSYRVVWRQEGRKQSETLPSLDAARRFRGEVEAAGGRWPEGWVKGVGWSAPEPPGAAQTFGEFAEQWLDAHAGIAERTRVEYARNLRLWLLPTFGDMPLDTIRPLDVAAWTRMVSEQRAAKTVRDLHGLLFMIFRAAVDNELLVRNPARGTKLPRADHGTGEGMRFLTPQEFGRLSAAAVSTFDRGIITTLVGTGLRWSELTGLQVGDVHLLKETPYLRVERAWKLGAGRTYLGPPKSARSRRNVTLSPEVVDVLLPLVAGKGDAELVFAMPNGQRVTHSNFYANYWRPMVKAAGLDGLRIHDLRHTHASWLLADGLPAIEVSRRLGHESITTTVDRYGHVMPQAGDAARDAVSRSLTRSFDDVAGADSASVDDTERV